MHFVKISLRHAAALSCYVVAIIAPWNVATPAAAQVCVGDCDGMGSVTVDEIITMVNIALGTVSIDDCQAGDSNGDELVTVDEIVTATSNALNGCPPPSGCETATVTVSLDFDPLAVPAIAGLELNVDYPPDLVSIPGTADDASVVERVTDITDTFGAAAIVDLDTGSDLVDDRLRTVYLAGELPIQPGGFERIRFDCEPGSPVPVPEDFVCGVPLASDQGGLAIEGVTCSVQVAVP